MIEERSEQDPDDTLDNIKKTDLPIEEVKKSSTLKKTQDGTDKITKKKLGTNKDLDSVTKAVPTKAGPFKKSHAATIGE